MIDCRYDYEYQGGHIPGAFNFNSREKIQKFYDTNKDVSKKVGADGSNAQQPD